MMMNDEDMLNKDWFTQQEKYDGHSIISYKTLKSFFLLT